MLDSALNWLGFGLCHQLPERSFFGGGLQVPVCARDTGIYVGFVVSLALIAWLHRGERPTGMPRMWVVAIAGLLLASMAWDGFTSYAGLRTTTNDLRLLTGLATGVVLPVILVPVLNSELWRRFGRGRVLEPTRRGVIWLLVLPLTFAIVRWGLPVLGAAYPVLVAAAILATYTTVNLVLVALMSAFDRRAVRFRDLWVALLIALGVSLVEIALAGALRVWLTGLSRALS